MSIVKEKNSKQLGLKKPIKMNIEKILFWIIMLLNSFYMFVESINLLPLNAISY